MTRWQTAGVVFSLIAGLLLLSLLTDSSDLQLLGLTLPAALVAFVFYALGVGAGYAAARIKAGTDGQARS